MISERSLSREHRRLAFAAALDAYNRGYGQNIDGLVSTDSIGNAQILTVADAQNVQANWQAAGFYAIAYDMSEVPGFAPSQTVISYRGTNFPEFSGGVVENIGKVLEFINKDLGGGWSIFTAHRRLTPRS